MPGLVGGLLTGSLVALPLGLIGCDGEALRTPRSWQRIFPTFTAPVHELVRDPHDPRVIYAACGRQALIQGRQLGGVLRSVDRGELWVEASRGIPATAEVLALAFAPPGFVAASESEEVGAPSAASREFPASPESRVSPPSPEFTAGLLAGTRGAGIFVSDSGGASWWRLGEPDISIDWWRLTVQALQPLPASTTGEAPAVAAGTREHGVFVSEDGGRTWEPRNQGLHFLTIQDLTLDAQGALLASTWYGGVYRSRDRGRSWEPLASGHSRLSVSSVVIADDGTLWIGLRNGGLLSAMSDDGEPSPTLRPAGESAIQGAGVLSMAVRGEGVVAGTSGRGVVFGRLGGSFERVAKGLDNTTVSAVLLDPDFPGRVIVGTWGGLYQAVPRHPRWVSGALPAVLLGLLLAAAAAAWRRSAAAAAGRIQRGLERHQP
ncbi:MAG: hypothetical protein MI919_05950, partial [Holophagales bacterium]|nr:hypothetical protein [Holophagales bacterium]